MSNVKGGINFSLEKIETIKDYFKLGMSVSEVAKACYISYSSAHRYKGIFERALAKEAKDKQTVEDNKKVAEHSPTSVSIDYADYLRVVELCEKFNVQRHVGLRCLLHPEEMKKQEAKLKLEDRVEFLEQQLEDAISLNKTLLEQLQ